MRVVLFCLCLGLIAGCQTAGQRISAIYGGAAAMAVLAAPEKAEAWRTTAPFALKGEKEGQAKLQDYLVLRGPVAVDTEVADEMAAILRRDIYEWDVAKGCEPIPGVAVRFVRGTDEVLVFFCFECDILLTYFNGQRVGGEDFDRAHRVLANLARRIFPDDPEIKKL